LFALIFWEEKTWTVEIRKDDGWNQIIESTWRRQAAK
jgi:hypothetical protein